MWTCVKGDRGVVLEGGGVILTHRGWRSIEVDLGVVRRQLLPCLHLTQHGVMPGKTVRMDTRFGRLVMLLRLQDSCFVQLGRDGRGGMAGKGERLLSEEGVLQGRVRLYPGVWVVLEHAQDQVLELAVVLRGVATLPSSGPRGPACLHPQDVIKGTTSWTPVSFLQTIGSNHKARHGYWPLGSIPSLHPEVSSRSRSLLVPSQRTYLFLWPFPEGFQGESPAPPQSCTSGPPADRWITRLPTCTHPCGRLMVSASSQHAKVSLTGYGCHQSYNPCMITQ